MHDDVLKCKVAELVYKKKYNKDIDFYAKVYDYGYTFNLSFYKAFEEVLGEHGITDEFEKEWNRTKPFEVYK